MRRRRIAGRPLLVAALVAAGGLVAHEGAHAVEQCVEFQVSDPARGSGQAAAVAAAEDGGFLAVWQGEGDAELPSVQARRFDAAGDPVGDQLRMDAIDAMPHGVSVATGAGGRFLVAWSGASAGDDVDGMSIQARLLDPSGLPLAAPFQVNTYTTGPQSAAAVSTDGGTGFVVAWASEGGDGSDTDGASIQARRIDADGVPAGPQFQVNVTTTGTQYAPSVAGGTGGGFVVSWREESYDAGYRTAVRARRFDSSGSGADPELTVGEVMSAAPQYAASAADGLGGFVVVWTGSDGLEAVPYDAAGVRGDPIPVETCATCFHRAVDVAGDGAGGFMVVWEGMGDVGGTSGQGWDVHGRIFDAAGMGEPEFKVNVETPDFQYDPAVAPNGDGFVVVWTRNGVARGPIDGRRLDAGRCVTTTTTSTTTSTLPTTLLESTRLVLREPRGHRSGRVVLELRDPGVIAGEDAVGMDGRIRIVGLGGGVDVARVLGAGGWRSTRRGLRYRDAETRLRIRPGRRIHAKLVGLDAGLPATDPTPILVVLELGGRRQCAAFPAASLDARRGRLVAKGGAAPASCEEPPG